MVCSAIARSENDERRLYVINAKKQKLLTKLAKLKNPIPPPRTKYDLRACLEEMLASDLTGPDKWKPGAQRLDLPQRPGFSKL